MDRISIEFPEQENVRMVAVVDKINEVIDVVNKILEKIDLEEDR